jgi:sulfite exporter TauE/SafE
MLSTVPAAVADVRLVAYLVVGLFGGAHCLGMCGPLVATYADRMPGREGDWVRLRQHALFNLGRTLSYAAVGAALGGLGGVVYGLAGLAAVADLVRAGAGLLVGGAVLAVGARYLLGGATPDLPVFGQAFDRVAGAATAHLDRLVAGPGVLGLGLVHGLLPCPLLYPAFAGAFATGSALQGGLSLAALGVGTVPSLFLAGTALGSPSVADRRRLHRALGAAFLALGLVPVLNGLSVLGVAVPRPPLPMPAVPGGG